MCNKAEFDAAGKGIYGMIVCEVWIGSLQDMEPLRCQRGGDIMGSSIVLSVATETLVRSEKSHKLARSPLRASKSMPPYSSTHV